MRKIRDLIDRFYPFTSTGTLLFVTAIYLIGHAFAANNVYAFLISAVAFAALFFFAFIGRIFSVRMLHVQAFWDSNRPLYSRFQNINQIVQVSGAQPPYFFRLHYRLKGKLIGGRDTNFHIFSEGSSSASGEIQIPLYFPVCGPAYLSGRMDLRDVFGLTRVRIGGEEERKLSVRPPTFAQTLPSKIQPASSEESSKRHTSVDEEKYYMREYIPGDRIKDINWKASIRVSELITRISPVSPEKTKLVHLDFRNVSKLDKDTPESLLHLNYLKSWVLSFIFALKKQDSRFEFLIRHAEGEFKLKTEDEMERFAVLLGELQYKSRFEGKAEERGIREKFVFTTLFDQDVSSDSQVPTHLFRTVKGPRVVHFLAADRWEALPGLWLFRRTPYINVRPVRSLSLVEEKLRLRYI